MEEEKKFIIPDSGCINFVGERPNWLPPVRIVKCGNKNKNNAPIEVKRTIRPGVRTLMPGESIDWRQEYC